MTILGSGLRKQDSGGSKAFKCKQFSKADAADIKQATAKCNAMSGNCSAHFKHQGSDMWQMPKTRITYMGPLSKSLCVHIAALHQQMPLASTAVSRRERKSAAPRRVIRLFVFKLATAYAKRSIDERRARLWGRGGPVLSLYFLYHSSYYYS